ncbi:MAG: hypothetical protein GXP26_04240 [Planctomycetes bacterium]|nr:hypothetical protein [Planctomycetota bacterium]
MTPKLTDEMRQALVAQPEGPIPVKDDRTQQVYVLMPREQYAHLHEDYVRRELQVAFDQADRGELSNLNMDEILAEAHRRYQARTESE